jgi:hypothetical protein
MIENGGVGGQPDTSDDERVNPWIGLVLVVGVLVGLALLLYLGASVSAGPAGGCGGG